MTVSKQCLHVVSSTRLSYKQAFPLEPLGQVESFDIEMPTLVFQYCECCPEESVYFHFVDL